MFHRPVISILEGNMESSEQNLREFCKKIENDVNRELFSRANSIAFIKMVGETMENHLNQLVSLRSSTKQWLDLMEFPIRGEIAEIAGKIIEIEDRLDRLDDQLYQTIKGVKECRNQMAGLALQLAELSIEFNHKKGEEM